MMQRKRWLDAASLFNDIGTWMENADATADELGVIVDSLKELGVPNEMILSAIKAAVEHRLETYGLGETYEVVVHREPAPGTDAG